MRLALWLSAPNEAGSGCRAAQARHPLGAVTDQAMSNWPSFTPAVNAVHSSGLKWSTGPSWSLESRSRTSAVTNPTSTQAGLTAPEKELLRNAGDWMDSVMMASFLVRRRPDAGGEIKIRLLTWGDSWVTNWGQTWKGPGSPSGRRAGADPSHGSGTGHDEGDRG